MRNWGVPMSLTPHSVVISFEARVGLGRRRSTLILLVVTVAVSWYSLACDGVFYERSSWIVRYWRVA